MSKELTNKPLFLWFLNDRFEPAEACRQIQFMKANGAGGYFLHWLTGGEPYMGEQWLNGLEHIIKHSANAGMEAWLYDEAWCPSGFAGGRVLAENPELQASRIWYEMVDLAAGERRSFHYELMKPLALVAVPLRNGIPQIAQAVDLRAGLGPVLIDPASPYRHDWGYYPHGGPPQLHWRQVNDTRVWQLDWQATDEPWRVYAFFARRVLDFDGVNRIDGFEPSAVARFIEETHECYASRFSHWFGSVIPGIMSDEPKYTLLPWHPEIARCYEAERKRTLLADLPCLVDGSLPGHEQARECYHRTVSALFHDSFIRPIADWCNAHDLLLTGHISPEEDPSHEVHYTGSIARHLTCFHHPGTDLIIQAVGNRERRGLNLGPCLASSVARQEGRTRVFCEVGACCEETVPLAELKHMADWLMVHGVNQIVWHGFAFSQDGPRKFIAGTNHYRDSNLTRQLATLNTYIRSTLDTLQAYKTRREVAVLKPHTAIRALTIPGQEVAACEAVDWDLIDVLWTLLTAQLSCDLLDEDSVAEWQVSDRTLGLGDVQYQVVVIPNCGLLGEAAAAALGSLHAEGGHIVAVDALPKVLTADGASDWNVSLGPTARDDMVAAVAEAAPPPIQIGSPYGDHEVLSMFAEDAAGNAMLYCVNLASEAVELQIKRPAVARTWACQIHGQGSILLPLDEEAVASSEQQSKQRMPLDGAWALTAPELNHVPLVDNNVIAIATGTDVQKIVVDRDHADELFRTMRIDGEPLAEAFGETEFFYEPLNRSVDCGEELRPGQHRIAFPDSMLPTVLLAGKFSVFIESECLKLLAPLTESTVLDCSECGYPFLRGPLMFEQEFTWSQAAWDRVHLCLPGRRGHVEVFLDDVYCGTCAWEPDEVVLPRLTPGVHRLRLAIMGSSIGILRGQPGRAGLTAPPVLTW